MDDELAERLFAKLQGPALNPHDHLSSQVNAGTSIQGLELSNNIDAQVVEVYTK